MLPTNEINSATDSQSYLTLRWTRDNLRKHGVNVSLNTIRHSIENNVVQYSEKPVHLDKHVQKKNIVVGSKNIDFN